MLLSGYYCPSKLDCSASERNTDKPSTSVLIPAKTYFELKDNLADLLTSGMVMKTIINRSNPHPNTCLRYLKAHLSTFALSSSVLTPQNVSGLKRKALWFCRNQSKMFRDSTCLDPGMLLLTCYHWFETIYWH